MPIKHKSSIPTVDSGDDMAVILVSEPPFVANRVARMLTLSRTGGTLTGMALFFLKGKW